MDLHTDLTNAEKKRKVESFIIHLRQLISMAEEICKDFGEEETPRSQARTTMDLGNGNLLSSSRSVSFDDKELNLTDEGEYNRVSRQFSTESESRNKTNVGGDDEGEFSRSLSMDDSKESKFPNIDVRRGEDKGEFSRSLSRSESQGEQVEEGGGGRRMTSPISFAPLGSPSIDAMLNMTSSGREHVPQSVVNTIGQYISNSSNLSLLKVFEVSKQLQMKGSAYGKSHNVFLWAAATKQNLEILGSSSRSLPIPIVLYDRVSPAANQLRVKGSPVVLLFCLASYDKARKGRHGIDHWIKQDFIQGGEFDCIHGTGSLVPNYKEAGSLQGHLVPFGKTVQNTQFPSYDLPYNEFLFYSPQQVSLQFVVVAK